MAVDIDHVRVVDAETARQVIAARTPADTVAIGTFYAELEQRADQEAVGQRVAFRGTLRANVDIGFGFGFGCDALLEEGTLVP